MIAFIVCPKESFSILNKLRTERLILFWRGGSTSRFLSFCQICPSFVSRGGDLRIISDTFFNSAAWMMWGWTMVSPHPFWFEFLNSMPWAKTSIVPQTQFCPNCMDTFEFSNFFRQWSQDLLLITAPIRADRKRSKRGNQKANVSMISRYKEIRI